MKTITTILFVLSVGCSINGFSQSDSIEYNHGVPVGDDDTVQNFPTRDSPPNSDLVKVPSGEIPDPLIKALKKKSIYNGWEKFPVYLNKASGIYDVRILQGSDTIVFGLNKDGNLVTIGEKTVDDQ